MAEPFELTSSFTKRLRHILIIIAGFFVIGVVSSYYSSLGFLNGLQQISSANRILNLSTLALESLDSTDQTLDKLLTGGNFKNVQFYFHQSAKITEQQLQDAIILAENFPEARKQLVQATEALHEYTFSIEKIFQTLAIRPEKIATEEIKSDLLVAHEFSADARETLRMSQITLKENSDQLFSSIYEGRFYPLIVASILSIFFFSFVIIVGFSIARRLSHALQNLGDATSAVGQGNLDFEAPILEHDEFGKLTFEFNGMVNSLKEKQQSLNLAMDRVLRLQHITSSFSEALVPDQVFEVIFQEAFETLGVNSGAVGLVDETGEYVELQRIQGYTEAYEETWKRFSLSLRAPMNEAIVTGKPVFLRNNEETKNFCPKVFEVLIKSGIQSTCAIPLLVEGKAVGSIAFSFSSPKEFAREERDFVITMVNQCSQALHRAQLYEAARDAIKVRDEFLSIASHELRTPLTPLKLQLQNLSRQVRKGNLSAMPTEQIMKAVESSDRQVNRLTSLIDDLLDVSRISAGKLTLNRESFNLAEMIEEIVGHYTHQLKENNSKVKVDVDSSLVGHLDKVRIEQVFINLLTNAAKYAPGKTIHVSLTRAGKFASLTVRDEGQGISSENQKRIFERFERVKDRDNVGGLGLGLYISRQIVEAHEGFIRVESTPGKGAAFIVELPLNEANL